MTNTMIDLKVAEIEKLEAQAKELKALVDELKVELKDELDSRQIDMVDTGLNKVFYEAYSKKSVDTKKLKDAGLYDEYSKESINLMFKITKSK